MLQILVTRMASAQERETQAAALTIGHTQRGPRVPAAR